MLLFDAHSHLPNPESPPPHHAQVICGTCEADWEAILAHAASDRRVIPTLGLHPWHVAEASLEWPSRMESLLRTHRIGVGECGLDFARKEADRAMQESVFRTQLRLAHAHRRPVAMHVVRAWGSLIDLLHDEGVPTTGAMIHAYSGSPETALALQAMGLFLSFSGVPVGPDRPKAREALRVVDVRHLLLETDGTADLAEVLEAAAGIRGVSAESLAAQTWENGSRCFKELMA